MAVKKPSPHGEYLMRGAIRDHKGKILVQDAPCWDVSLRYEVLVARVEEESEEVLEGYLKGLARAPKADGTRPDPAEAVRRRVNLRTRVDTSWERLAALTSVSSSELLERAGKAVSRVRAVKKIVERTKGREMTVGEERSHRFLIRIDDEKVARGIERELGSLPWVRMVRKHQRSGKGLDSLVHVIGKTGTADARRATADPFATDAERALRVGDRCGISGVERLADPILRASRPAMGRSTSTTDVFLSIDAALQEKLYQILKRGVDRSPHPCGGAAVVIDVPTGEIRALVSCPSYPFEPTGTEMEKLSTDQKWLPLRFRAVSHVFPPGSTIKPAVLCASLSEGTMTTETKVTCEGVFRRSISDAYRCWVYNRSKSTHKVMTPETAIKNSCNIFFFTAGDRLGAKRLVEWYARFGLGQTQGTGLIEESPGILPTAEWLAKNRLKAPTYQSDDGWNLAIGQGDLGLTPLQLANFAATIARGRFLPVTLVKDAQGRPVVTPKPAGEPFPEGALTTVRRGMWRVVNEKGGTADKARLSRQGAVLCGKTGSAQVPPRVVGKRYSFRLKSNRRVVVEAPTLDEARRKLPEKDAVLLEQKIAATYPDPEEDNLMAHAWFIGFTGPSSAPRGAPPASSCYALSVLVEYGGAGGDVAAPIGKSIAECVLAHEARPAAKDAASAGKRRPKR